MLHDVHFMPQYTCRSFPRRCALQPTPWTCALPGCSAWRPHRWRALRFLSAMTRQGCEALTCGAHSTSIPIELPVRRGFVFHVGHMHISALARSSCAFDAVKSAAHAPCDSAGNKRAAAQVGMLAQKAGYETLYLEGLTTPAQWAAAAAAAVRNAAALENAMLQVILAATAVKLVARPALPTQA